MSLLKGLFKSKEQIFWNWLVENKSNLEEMKNRPIDLMQSILRQLGRYNRELTLEVGVNSDNIVELTISAGGLKGLFRNVKKLVEAAPELEGWKIFAFRQIKPIKGPLIVRGIKFLLEDMKFKPDTSQGYFDIVIYHSDFSQEMFEPIGEAAFLMMDMLVGEYDVSTKIDKIDFQKLPEDYENQGILPLAQIKECLEKFYKEKVAQ